MVLKRNILIYSGDKDLYESLDREFSNHKNANIIITFLYWVANFFTGFGLGEGLKIYRYKFNINRYDTFTDTLKERFSLLAAGKISNLEKCHIIDVNFVSKETLAEIVNILNSYILVGKCQAFFITWNEDQKKEYIKFIGGNKKLVFLVNENNLDNDVKNVKRKITSEIKALDKVLGKRKNNKQDDEEKLSDEWAANAAGVDIEADGDVDF